MEQNQLTREVLEKLIELIHNKNEDVSAIIVVKSRRTGDDHTYKITANNRLSNRKFTVYMESGYDNYDYVYSCYNQFFEPKSITGKVARGGVWLLRYVVENKIDDILQDAILYHTGKCIKCNRTLTDATSIEYGMGPECRNK